HVILEEAPPAAPPPTAPARAELVPLSARSPEAVRALARAHRAYASEPVALRDIAYTTALRRGQHEHRLAVVARSTSEYAQKLDAWLSGQEPVGLASGRAGAVRLAFVFTGMGPQWWAMGRQLLEQEPVFRAAIERCDALLARHADWSLLAELNADERSSRMAETQVAQPANFALQVALTELWRFWGIEPDGVVGHSAGEVAAGWAAGAFDLDEAIRIIFHRARLQHRTTGQGKLVAVGLPVDEARASLRGFEQRISIAAVNSPSAVTLVGDPDALEQVIRPLQERQVFCRYLKVDVPYHSHYMDLLRPELETVLGDISTSGTARPLFSTVSGQAIAGTDMDAAYWWRNVREPVYFAAAAERMVQDGYTIFLEVGPHPVLGNSIKECLTLRGREGAVLHSLRRGDDEQVTMLAALGALYTLGQPVAFRALHGAPRPPLRLPGYPWQRERHWAESDESRQDRLGDPGHPLLGRRLAAAQPMWQVKIDRRVTPFLDDHKIQSAVVYPGAGYVEMMAAAAREFAGADATVLEFDDVEFRRALFLPDGEVATLQVMLNPSDLAIEIHSRPSATGEAWPLHARATLARARREDAPRVDLSELLNRCATPLASDECYARFQALGFGYGPAFQGIDQLWLGADEAVARTRAHESVVAELTTYFIHPSLLDACFQVLLMAVLGGAGEERRGAFMPIGAKRFWVYGRPAPGMWIHTRITAQDASGLSGDIRLIDADGRLVLEIHGLRAQSLEQAGPSGEAVRELLYELQWVAESATGDVARQPGRWLVLGNGDDLERDMVALLEERGNTCVVVRPGQSYADHSVDPRDPEHFQWLLSRFEGGGCHGILHLWGAEAHPERLEQVQAETCLAVMHLVQAVDRAGWRELPRMWLTTRGAQRIGDDRPSAGVAAGALWGLARTLAHQEHMELWGGIVDLDPRRPRNEARLLLEAILDTRPVDQLAFRGGQRFVPRMVRRRDLAAQTMPVRLRADGSYLVTGGLGGLGLQVARWLVEHGARRLILAGRGALPRRSTWRLVEAEGGPTAERIAAVRQLESLGASVHAVALDVADEAALTSFLASYAAEGWPPIRGVVHLAGVSRPQLLLTMDAATFESALRPKVLGAWLLHRDLQDAPLDFFVLFSSIASLGFSMGQANYAAGNAFLDALAQHRHALGLPALSINWGAWAEVGMASQLDLVRYFSHRGLPPMPPRQGIEAFAALLTSDVAQATVVAADWPVVDRNNYPLGSAPEMLAELVHEQRQRETSAIGVGQPGKVDRELLLSVEPEQRAALLQQHLLEIAGRVLRIGQAALEATQPLNTLGLDSMMAIELKNRIEQSLHVSISVVELLQGCSVGQLAERVLEQLQPVQADAEAELAELLAEAEQLSADDLRALLAESEGVAP
ncbi:MAG: polyketide synthase dehydratase domain-containing protein, partial [Chloroflexota bacterium]|nr:polyketide synthase dehydratase domain-containing protein [Chloroflexota bacterium]